jgi:hypothetical protein
MERYFGMRRLDFHSTRRKSVGVGLESEDVKRTGRVEPILDRAGEATRCLACADFEGSETAVSPALIYNLLVCFVGFKGGY